jgi:hypothetical protein
VKKCQPQAANQQAFFAERGGDVAERLGRGVDPRARAGLGNMAAGGKGAAQERRGGLDGGITVGKKGGRQGCG